MALVFALILLLITVAAWRFGADSRDGRDWASRSEPRRGTVAGSCC